MALSNPVLWKKIENFALDDQKGKVFLEKFIETSGLKRETAIEAIHEYRKFIYLAAISDQHVTPSKIVDEVWHLHLTFSKNYWEKLCGDVLQKQLHHFPGSDNPAENAKFARQYGFTRQLYRSEFGSNVDQAYWPPADESGVETKTFLDGLISIGFTAGFCFVLGGIALLALSDLGFFNQSTKQLLKNLIPSLILLSVIIMIVGGLVLSFTNKLSRSGKGDGGGCGGGCGD